MVLDSIWITNEKLFPSVNSVGRHQTAELQQNNPDEAVWITRGMTEAVITLSQLCYLQCRTLITRPIIPEIRTIYIP